MGTRLQGAILSAEVWDLNFRCRLQEEVSSRCFTVVFLSYASLTALHINMQKDLHGYYITIIKG